MEYFHVSNDLLERDLKLRPEYGSKTIHPSVYTSSDHFHAQYLREMVIEDFRLIHFPNKPSRLNSIYLFDDIRLALQFKKEQGREFLYRVGVGENAKIHKADMILINSTARKSVSEIQGLTMQYYEGIYTDNPFHEILCEGEVKIIGEIGINNVD